MFIMGGILSDLLLKFNFYWDMSAELFNSKIIFGTLKLTIYLLKGYPFKNIFEYNYPYSNVHLC